MTNTNNNMNNNNNNTQIIDLVSIARSSGNDYAPVINAINKIIELTYVLIHPDASDRSSGNRFRFASTDICVPYCPAPSYVQSTENYIQYNQEELANLLAYLRNSWDTFEDHSCSPLDELYNYRLSQITGNDKLVLRDDCIPRHTS